MPRRVARHAAVAVAGLVALLASACTDATPGAGPTATGTAVTSRATAPAPTETTREPLVVDTVFDHATLDPTRQFDRSGLLVSKAVYQTLTDLDRTDPTKVVPGIAEYTLSPEGRWLTMRLRRGLVFSDGTPVTTDDVVFTLQRAQGLGGTASAILGTVNIVKVDDRTFTLSSPRSNFALPAILANPAFGILNSAAVKANGGAIGPGDTAARYLSGHSAGSGPYVLTSATSGRVTLAANPVWTGAPPAFSEVVLRDVAPRDQVGDVRSGRADVALDLSPAQAAALTAAATATSTSTSTGGAPATGTAPASGTAAPGPDGTTGTATGTATGTTTNGTTGDAPRPVAVTASKSSTLAFLSLSRNPRVNRWTADPSFVEAVRKGLDVDALARAAGDAHPAAGLVPSGIVGSLEDGAVPTVPPAPTHTGDSTPTGTPAPPGATPSAPGTGDTGHTGGTGTPAPGRTGAFPPPTAVRTAAPRDLAGARAALRRSGYRGEPVPLTYAVDVPIAGIQRSTIAAQVRDQLAEVGIRVVLDPKPSSSALTAYRSGRSAFGLWSWNPDYPDPESYLAFAPGELVGLRAGWQRGQDALVDGLTEAARESVGDDRPGAYAAWQVAMNERGPFVPLLQPMTHVATGPRVHRVPANPVWTVDLAAIS